MDIFLKIHCIPLVGHMLNKPICWVDGQRDKGMNRRKNEQKTYILQSVQAESNFVLGVGPKESSQ